MIKHFCDICGKELSGNNGITDVTLLTDLQLTQFNTLPTHETKCEICLSCARTVIATIKEMRKGKGVVYVEKK